MAAPTKTQTIDDLITANPEVEKNAQINITNDEN